MSLRSHVHVHVCIIIYIYFNFFMHNYLHSQLGGLLSVKTHRKSDYSSNTAIQLCIATRERLHNRVHKREQTWGGAAAITYICIRAAVVRTARFQFRLCCLYALSNNWNVVNNMVKTSSSVKKYIRKALMRIEREKFTLLQLFWSFLT